MWQSLSITKKIWLSLSIIILGYFGSTVFGFILGQKTESRLRDVSGYMFTAAIQSRLALSEFNEHITEYADAVVTESTDSLERAKNKSAEVRKALQEIERLEGMNPGRVDEIHETLKRFETFSVAANTIYTAMTETPELEESVMERASRLSQETNMIRKELESFASLFSDDLKAEVSAIQKATKMNSYMNIIVFLIVVLLSIVYIRHLVSLGITGPVARIVETANAIASGNFQKEINIRSKDEIGELADAFRHMQQTIDQVFKETEMLIQAIQDGNLTRRSTAAEFRGGWQEIIIGINKIIEAFMSPFNIMASYIDRISDGEIPEKIILKYKGDFNKINNNLNLLIDSMNQTAVAAEAIASGNLNVDVRERSEHDRMMQALNRMIQKLNQIMDETNRMIRAVGKGRLDITGHAESFEGGWRDLVTGVNNLIAALSGAVSREAAVTMEMELAKQIQTALLPREMEHDDLEIEAMMIPADEVGGDFYDVLNGHGEHLWLGIGDVSGHGVTPGLIMMMAQTANTVIARNFEQSPREVVIGINDLLYQNVHERLGSDHFMTFTALKYTGQGRFNHAGAHLPMIVYRQGIGKCENIQTKGTFLNFVADISEITEDSVFELGIGDTLVMYTDGLTEAKNRDGRLLGLEGLTEIVTAHISKDTEDFRNAVMNDVLAWCGHDREDDFTLVAVRRAN
ncbi:SpoIIE family protein phosphatase [Desulfonema magnum]|uniref:PPM-type phosphatase domain-containing protein n=1 Tax=Desulfonema magnum TaxID=45655 RepID=A0A975BSV3_9BACT|nr:SpoIIE family protein phosphatase [Desulfonema magnum]QTA91102.1 PPM-type phosphatase domain-containing protein [Desulfonema magnum]